MDNGNSTIISYDQVRDCANKILNCSKIMQDLFNDFTNQINTATTEDAYQGSASDSLSERFHSLKNKFDSYTAKVKEFSDIINSAADQTERVERELASQADNLAG